MFVVVADRLVQRLGGELRVVRQIPYHPAPYNDRVVEHPQRLNRVIELLERGQITGEVHAALQRALATCRAHGVPAGSPNNQPHNIEQRITDGFRFLALAAARDLSLLHQGRAAAGRAQAMA